MPRAAAKKRFTETITVQIGPELRAWVEGEAERRSTTLSAYIRGLLVTAREQVN